MRFPQQDTIKKEFTEGVPGHIVQARYFYFDTHGLNNPNLHILCGGYEKCAADFELNRKKLAFYTVKFTLGGKGTFVHDNRSYPLGFGSLTIFGPQTPHQFKADPYDPMEHIFIIFTGHQAGDLLKINQPKNRYCIQASNSQFVASLMEHILNLGLEKPQHAQELCQKYLKLLLLEQTINNLQIDHNSGSWESFQKCKHYLDHHFTNISSVSQLASECNLDIRYIARLFRKYGQVRPYDYLIQLKMAKAANLLLTTSFSVKQISQMVGLEDPYHFSRVFKKMFRHAPTEYRQKMFEFSQ